MYCVAFDHGDRRLRIASKYLAIDMASYSKGHGISDEMYRFQSIFPAMRDHLYDLKFFFKFVLRVESPVLKNIHNVNNS